MIHIRSAREIELLQQSGQIVAGALALAKKMIQPGLKTGVLNEAIDDFITNQGAWPSFKHYGEPPFPAASCISVNEAIVHGIPGSYILQEGDIVSIDVGAKLNGYHGDAARTFAVGNITDEDRRLIEVTEQSFWAGVKWARPGNRIGDISHAVEEVALAAGYGVVKELVGHGVGEQLHEDPNVPNYGRAGHGPRLQAGMVLAIEPMINQGTAEIVVLDDEWTIVTADRKRSAHYENTVVITDDEPIFTTLLIEK